METENEFLSDLEARKRNRKVLITDIAIQKIPYIKYKEISEEHYDNLYELAKYVLQLSKDKNDSNEVAIVYSLDFDNLVKNNMEYLGVSFVSIHNLGTDLKNAQKAANHFLNECFKANIIYENR